ncbi:MAG: S8 family serine peptidase [Runella sp.]
MSVVYASVFAQHPHPISPKDSVQNLTSIFQKRYGQNRSLALQTAKKYKWPIHKKYANNRWITLQGIDKFGEPIYYTTHNAIASTGTHTDRLYSGGGLGLDLKGDLPVLDSRLCIWDGGLPRLSHVEFGGRVRQKDNNPTLSDHATHLSATIAAAGVNPQVKGMAYGAKLDVWDYTDDLTEMAREASKILVSNHAYGPVVGWFFNPSRPGNDPKLKWEWWGNTNIHPREDYRFGFYDEKARDLDQLAYNSPYYLIVKSADNKRAETGPPIGTPYFLRNTNQTSILERSRNDGYDVIPSEANAKNILTVGGAEPNLQTEQMANFRVADFSGWGPTDDGRIKPDLLGIGTNVLSAISSSNTAYATMSGTSTACANVSGTLILLQELFYRRQNSFMRSATLKGLALHTADKPEGKIGPSYEYGWGLLNAEKAAKVLLNDQNQHAVLESTLRPNQTFQQKIIAAGNTPLVVTLCWTDPEAPATRVSTQTVDDPTPKLINDLDLRLSDENNNTSFPWILNPANPAQSAIPGDNTRDNVEQVMIANPIPGKIYTLTVRHKRTLQNNGQPYSVIISGIRSQNCEQAVRFSKGKDTTLCGGASLQLAIEGDYGLTYEWYRNGRLLSGEALPQITVNQEGDYTVKAVGFQCSAESKTIKVKVANLTAKISPEGSVTICNNTDFTLKVSPEAGGQTYQWYRNGSKMIGASVPTITTNVAGVYTASITNGNCTATSAPTTVLSAVQTPSISTNSGTVIPNGGSIRLTTHTGDRMTYQWKLNDVVIPTATGPRLVATLPGKYTVTITQNNCSVTSKPLVLTTVEYPTGSPIKKPAPEILIINENLRLFPNPAISTLTVAYDSDNTYNLVAELMTVEGVKLAEKLLYDNGSVFLNDFDISTLPRGTYFIRLNDGRKSIAKPFVKH